MVLLHIGVARLVRTPSREMEGRDEEVTPSLENSIPTAFNDRLGFEAAVRPLLPRLFRLAVALTGAREEAEDLLQNALVRAYKSRDTFTARGSLDGWLVTIIRHEHEDTVRVLARRRSRTLQVFERFGVALGDLWPQAETDPEQELLRHESGATLLAHLRSLSEPYRTVVWLCDIEELGYEKVAQMLGLPIGTVKSRHARGRVRLRRSLEQRSSTSPRGVS
jgi:RNA polymerase sigma-70 factor (ECF subfamily)